ncbi:MAG: putative porin [Chthoniobacterales bacterium]
MNRYFQLLLLAGLSLPLSFLSAQSGTNSSERPIRRNRIILDTEKAPATNSVTPPTAVATPTPTPTPNAVMSATPEKSQIPQETKSENPNQVPKISSVGGKNRIVFNDTTPTPHPDTVPESDTKVQSVQSAEAKPKPTVEMSVTSDDALSSLGVSLAEATPKNIAAATQTAEAERNVAKAGAASPSPTPAAKIEAVAAASPSPTIIEKVSEEGVKKASQEVAQNPAKVEKAPATNEGNSLPSPVKQNTAVPVAVEPPLPTKDGGEMTPSQSVTINLINKLVERGSLSKEDAQGMYKQAEAEAEAAREQNQADMFAIAQVAATQAVSDQAVVGAQGGVPTSVEDVKVTYIPEPVKTQMREDIKSALLAEARAGRLAIGSQRNVPEWLNRIHPFADIRVRAEAITYPGGNDVTGAFPNFNAINTGAPFDVTGTQFAPQLNANADRSRFRLRARFGAEADLGENFSGGLRVATGDTNSPITANQTFGSANGQGGDFSKYAIWLDRAYIRYVVGDKNNKNASLVVGRFENPFFSTPLIWDDELGFDGIALQARYEIFQGVVPFLNAGAFAVYNTDLNFSSNQPEKYESYDKYLYAIQGGVDWTPHRSWHLKTAGAYYYFQNIEGQLSTPYTPLTINDQGDTDNSRPSFAQKGNTYMALRNIIPDASNDFGAINQWQYYGLATQFHEAAFTGRLDYNGFEPFQISLIGEFVQNIAFDSNAINLIAVNNRGANDDDLSDTIGIFDGGGTAWLMDLKIGAAVLEKRWDWNAMVGYRYIGSDAVVDGFNDSDFGLGGTNMKGFTVGGALALSSNVWLAAKWMGADSIAGPQYKVNIFQLDIHAKF